MNIILNEQAFRVLQQIEQTNILPDQDTGGVYFDEEFSNWVAYKVLRKTIGFTTVDTQEEGLKFLISHVH